MKDTLGLIGKNLREVAEVLGTEYSFRVVERDGVKYMVTADHVAHRVNLRLADGTVTGYSLG